MGIHIHVDLELSRRHKRIIRAAIVFGAVGIGVAVGAPINTSWISSGGVVSSAQLKGNLDGLQDQLTGDGGVIARLGALEAPRRIVQQYVAADGGVFRTSVNGLHCGITGTQSGAWSGPSGTTGWRAGKLLCESACSSPTAHACDVAEMMHSADLNVPVPTAGWVKGTANYQDITGSVVANDCAGWVLGLGNPGPVGIAWKGAYWDLTTPPGHLGFRNCNDAAPVPILCCD